MKYGSVIWAENKSNIHKHYSECAVRFVQINMPKEQTTLIYHFIMKDVAVCSIEGTVMADREFDRQRIKQTYSEHCFILMVAFSQSSCR